MSNALGELFTLDPLGRPRESKPKRTVKPKCDYCGKIATSMTPPFGWGVPWNPNTASPWRWCDGHAYIAAEVLTVDRPTVDGAKMMWPYIP